jgi:hypothetical protein
MARLLRFLRYPLSEQWILVQVSILLILIRIALILLPFRTISRFIQRIGRKKPGPNVSEDLFVRRILWAINRTAGPILGDRACLTQALVGQVLLGRRGVDTQLRIGVLKDGDGRFQAHAWLESDGQVLLGGTVSDLRRYTVLPDWDAIQL